jgi:Uma2 family endonuclease
MTAEPVPTRGDSPDAASTWPVPPRQGYTVDDLFNLPGLPPHTELIDGSLVFVRPQRKFHSPAMYLLERGLRRTVPEELRMRRQMAVVLSPGTVPEPDLCVVRAEADGDGRQTRYEAADVVLAVEVVSPDSEERDRDTKPHKYARAGIPYF